VKLIKPTPPKNPYWRVMFKDVETGKVKWERLPPDVAGHGELRREYAIALHKKLGHRRDEIAAGAAPHRAAGMLIADAFKKYFETWGASKRESTRGEYRRGCDLFLAWCATPAIGARTVRQLNKGMLRAYAGSRVAAQLNDKKCGRSGARRPATANKELRWLSAVLGECRAMGLVNLTRDDIADGLARLDEPIVKRDFCRTAELRAILDCARRHDLDLYGGDYSGRLLPVVLFILLSGVRADEALHIQWTDVFRDDDGHLKIRVRAEVSKNARERIIDTEHSALLAWLVSASNSRTGSIIGGSEHSLFNARQRLIKQYGAPPFDYQKLRVSCGTYLSCSPAIFGAAAPYMSALQLGHTIQVAQRHYLGAVKVSPAVKTLEAAMQLEIDPATCPKL
jgi:integrase